MSKLKKFLIIPLLVLLIFLVAKKADNQAVELYNSSGQKIASFKVEVAKTPEQQQKGLMGRKMLAEDKGMLFIFEDDRPRSFWMKNTLIPLDIIYFDKNKKVVSIVNSTQPCQKDPCQSYPSEKPAQFVLEIAGGLAEKLGINEEEEVEFNL